MKARRFVILCLTLTLAGGLLSPGLPATTPSLSVALASANQHLATSPDLQARVESAVHSAPLMFIENTGQFDPQLRFQTRGQEGTVHLAEDGIWYTFLAPEQARRSGSRLRETFGQAIGEEDQPRQGVNVKVSFEGADPHPQISGIDRLDTSVSYLTGNKQEGWYTDVPVWAGVRYADLYPGIDLEITSEDGRLAQRILAAPGADLSAVRLRVEGADRVTVEDQRLRLTTDLAEFTLPLLTAEGAVPDGRPSIVNLGHEVSEVTSPFASVPPLADASRLADDPSDLIYSTFLGGERSEQGYRVAVDSSGAAYVVGYTYSSGFPTTPGAFDTSSALADAFVVKVNPAGTTLAYAAILGGFGEECWRDEGAPQACGIAVDAYGQAYIVGATTSSDFPTTPGAYDTSFGGALDVFVTKLNAGGTGLIYSTFLGPAQEQYPEYGAAAIALDGSGAAYVVGDTFSSGFPTTSGAYDTTYNGVGDVFVAKLNEGGTALAYSTFLGGTGGDFIGDIAVNTLGEAYVTGYTNSGDFPATPGAYDTTHNGGFHDGFVARLNAAGSGVVYSTFLGGSGTDWGQSIAVDASGAAYIAGWTRSSDFPTTPGAFAPDYQGGWSDAFIAKLDAAGTGLAYSTFVGGAGADQAYSIDVDGARTAYAGGWTYSSAFPTTSGAYDETYNGGEDAVVFRLSGDGSQMLYSSFLGGTGLEWGVEGIFVDRAGAAYVVGQTASSDFPTSPGAFDTSYNGGYFDVFVAKLATTPTCERIPVILVHGWHGSEQDDLANDYQMGLFADMLEADGYTEEDGSLFYATGINSTKFMIDNARELQKTIHRAQEQSGCSTFDIIGHSFGGLTARAYVEGGLYAQDRQPLTSPGGRGIKIRRVFMLGTPNGGVSLHPLTAILGLLGTDLGQDWPSIAELLLVMPAWDVTHTQPPEVAYRLIAGVAWECGWPYAPFAWPCDGLVLRDSVHALSSGVLRAQYPNVQTPTTPDIHGCAPESVPIKPRAYNCPDNSTYKSEIAPYLGGSVDTGESLETAELQLSGPSDWAGLAHTPLVTGVITTGQTITATVNIDAVGTTEFYLGWPVGNLDLSLTDPVGTSIISSTAETDPNVDFFALETDALLNYESYVISDTVTGDWVLTIEAIDTYSDEIPFAAFAIPDSELSLSVFTDQDWYPKNQEAIITATLTLSVTAVTGASTEATIYRPDTITDTVTLYDDGAHNDASADDGTYGNSYASTDAGGYYAVLATASGNLEGSDYERAAETGFSVSPETASLTGSYSDYPEDVDGNGKHEHLVLNIAVDVAQTGQFELSAKLLDGNGDLVVGASDYISLTLGVQDVPLRFDGETIRTHGVDGPFTITDVYLFDAAGAPVKLDEAFDVWTTAAYDHGIFGNQWFVYVPLATKNY